MATKEINDNFSKAWTDGTGFAVILSGSDSDAPHVAKIAKALGDYGIPYDARVCSAHKQAEELHHVLRSYENGAKGPKVYISTSSLTGALSGVASWQVIRGPVLSCPSDIPNSSCTGNPSGSSNAYIEKPANVARCAAQILAWNNPKILQRLADSKQEKIQSLERADSEFNKRIDCLVQTLS